MVSIEIANTEQNKTKNKWKKYVNVPRYKFKALVIRKHWIREEYMGTQWDFNKEPENIKKNPAFKTEEYSNWNEKGN